MNNNTITKKNDQLARPLSELIPLIKEDLRSAKAAAEEAAQPYYVAAGEKLWEAKASSTGGWGKWLRKNFHLSEVTAYAYMRAAKKFSARRNIVYRTASEAYGDTKRHPGHRPEWHPPVHDVLKNLRTENYNLRQHEISESKERLLERKLALRLIDIGYKVLSVELHPDKGGSHDAMSRLNRVRKQLKHSIG